MPNARIADQKLWVDDQSFPFLGGEVHYWRHNPQYWQPVLQRVRDLRLPLVSSYVCWDYHEFAEGQFDFTGQTNPQRNLPGFLDLVAEMGLWLLIRPGPYIYSEWRNGGIPDRAARYHRLHPAYQQAAAEYMTAAVEVIKPYLVTHGGPIVLFQAENEPDPWPHLYESQMGLGSTPGLFQDFLRERYQNIAALNEAWETHLSDFDQARPVTTPAIKTRGYRNRHLDFVRFRHWGTHQIIQWTVDTYRALGVDVPIYVNTYTIFDIQNWRDLETMGDLVGPDAYPTCEFGAPDEHWKFLDLYRYPRSYSVLPCIPELQAGIWEGGQYSFGVPTPNHYQLVALSALLAGIVGWNWYMLANRDNWLMSPVNEIGNIRPNLYTVFAELVRVFRDIDPPSLEKQVHTAISVNVLERTANFSGNSSERLRRALYEADIDYDCFDTDTGRISRPLLFYAGSDWLSESAQQRLLAYVQNGGNLVFFQDYPTLDDSLCPLNWFDLPEPISILQAAFPNQLCIHLGDETVTLSTSAFFIFDHPDSILAERIKDTPSTGDEFALHTELPVGQRFPVGFRRQIGQGTLTVLGVEPTPALLVALHRWFGISIPSRSTLPAVNTALFRRNNTFYLIAVNNSDEERYARIDLNSELFSAKHWTARDLSSGELLEGIPHLMIRLSRKSGTVIEIK